MSTASSIPPLHQGIDISPDASSYSADSRNASSADKATHLMNLLSSQILKQEDLLNVLGKLDDRKFAVVRKNLEALGYLDRSIRVVENRAAGKFSGLK